MLCQPVPEVIMKTILNICFILFFGLSIAIAQTDTSKVKNKEENKEQVKEETKLKNQSEENQLKNEIKKGLNQNEKGKRKKDVFIDKDGDGISDTRVGGMSLNKLRKRVRGGGHGNGQGGDQGNGGNGSGGPGGR